jgi:hypothetical protein
MILNNMFMEFIFIIVVVNSNFVDILSSSVTSLRGGYKSEPLFLLGLQVLRQCEGMRTVEFFFTLLPLDLVGC